MNLQMQPVESIQCWLYTFLRLTLHLVLVNQLGGTSLGKTNSQPGQSLIVIALHQGVEPCEVSLTPLGMLTRFSLCSLVKAITLLGSVAPLSYSEDTIPQQTSWSSCSPSLCVPLFKVPWALDGRVVLSVRVRFSMVNSLHFWTVVDFCLMQKEASLLRNEGYSSL